MIANGIDLTFRFEWIYHRQGMNEDNSLSNETKHKPVFWWNLYSIIFKNKHIINGLELQNFMLHCLKFWNEKISWVTNGSRDT